MGLVVNKVSSGYRQITVIKEVSFEIESGQIVGLIGLNGAGKSTLLKTILGLLPIQSGSIGIDGLDSRDNQAAYAANIAYVPETPVLYEELTLKEHLEMTALGYGIDRDTVMKRAQLMLKSFRLDQHLNWFPTHFSKGMKQKVMIMCALVTQAKLLIIDEPFLGLDPLAMNYFSQLLLEHAKRGGMVLFTTHVLSIAEDLCQSFILLKKGQVVGRGDLQELRQQFDREGANLMEIYLTMTQEDGHQSGEYHG